MARHRVEALLRCKAGVLLAERPRRPVEKLPHTAQCLLHAFVFHPVSPCLWSLQWRLRHDGCSINLSQPRAHTTEGADDSCQSHVTRPSTICLQPGGRHLKFLADQWGFAIQTRDTGFPLSVDFTCIRSATEYALLSPGPCRQTPGDWHGTCLNPAGDVAGLCAPVRTWNG